MGRTTRGTQEAKSMEAEVKKCISCGERATLSSEDGVYCKDCMQAHLLEKMFVQLTKLQGK